MTTGVTRVGIVGCGVMGAGIAEACAVAGLDVVVAVSRPSSLSRARKRLRTSLARAKRDTAMSEAEVEAALERVVLTADLIDLADRQLVFEAVAEDESLKVEVFAALDKVLEDPEAILASNTSSIPITKLGRGHPRTGHVIGTHFFNPVARMPLVEVVASLFTAEVVTARVEMFLTSVLGKQVIRAQDRAGFVVNALLVPYLLSAIRMLESGAASAADIDKAMILGCHHPMGPLQLVDFIGLDVIHHTAEALHVEFRESQYAPPPLLMRMVEAGLMGKKTGRGFHDYPSKARGTVTR
jgi:3-hydroxybutyryl-CoA dehydrogenase